MSNYLNGVASKLNREDHRYTKHDSVFSDWKVLIGAYDWEEHSEGKEGRERYRVHNLPKSCSSPGLYELAISPPSTLPGRKKPDPTRIVVVYLGQADNVRSRLQQYGRSGSHLEDGPSLFSSIFSRGYSLLFRWAHMLSKLKAEATEAQLLRTFDYAWNKGCNGPRRPVDIINKLHKLSSSPPTFLHTFMTRLRAFAQRPVGVHVNPLSPPGLPFNPTPPVFKTTRTRPRPLSTSSGDRWHFLPSDLVALCGAHPCQETDIKHADVAACGAHPCQETDIKHAGVEACGAHLDDGSTCRTPPAEGRKRCSQHKGMRIHLRKSTKELNRGGRDTGGGTRTCGVVGADGSVCGLVPQPGRKRCGPHKGMRVRSRTAAVARVSPYGLSSSGPGFGP